MWLGIWNIRLSETLGIEIKWHTYSEQVHFREIHTDKYSLISASLRRPVEIFLDWSKGETKRITTTNYINDNFLRIDADVINRL